MIHHINIYLHSDGTVTYVGEKENGEKILLYPVIAIDHIGNGTQNCVITGVSKEGAEDIS